MTDARGFIGFRRGYVKTAYVVLFGARLVPVGGTLIVRGLGFVLFRRSLVLIRTGLVYVRRSLIRIRIGPCAIDRTTGRLPTPSTTIRLA